MKSNTVLFHMHFSRKRGLHFQNARQIAENSSEDEDYLADNINVHQDGSSICRDE